MTKPGVITSLGLLGIALLLVSCAGVPAQTVTPTPDISALETEVAYKLAATLTAKAPPTATHTATFTPLPPTQTPTPTPTVTPSPTLYLVASGPLLAFVRAMPDRTTNIMLHDPVAGKEDILEHLQQPESVSDVAWSRDGQWIAFVSAHDYIHSRNNERNIFIMRPDGSDLRMVTGDYVDPEEAAGPFVTLHGAVEGGRGSCLISAQGAANPVTIEADEPFELSGVPASSRWLRAVCTQEGEILQGDIDLDQVSEDMGAIFIPVQAQGQGWTNISLARKGDVIAGAFYRWSKDQEGKVQQTTEGLMVDLDGKQIGKVQLPPDTTLANLDWSPIEDIILGTLTAEKSAFLWRWDGSGASLGKLVEIPNPAQEILSTSHAAWSLDGEQIAFSLRRWYWWGENKFRTEVMLVAADGQDLRTLIETEWGADALDASWTGDGERIYYQVSTGAPDDQRMNKGNGDIWYKDLLGDVAPVRWTEDGASYMPAANP